MWRFNPIIVVGPGRCGTSLVAGILYHLGVFMGERFVSADTNNPWGHWEDIEFKTLSSAILSKNIISSQWRKEVKRLLQKRKKLKRVWGWKDPATAEIISLYLPLLDNPKFIRCHRNAEDIERSMVKAYFNLGWTFEVAHQVRQRREASLNKYLRGYDVLDIEFDELINNSENTLNKIIKFLTLKVGKQQIEEALNFIKK